MSLSNTSKPSPEEEPKTPKLFFDASKLPQPKPHYVCWVDMMGTSEAMSRSLMQSANFIGKLHVAFLKAKTNGIRIYPVMDGAYVTSESQPAVLRFLSKIFSDLARDFALEVNPSHRFLVRSAVAFGPVVHGEDLPESASTELHRDSSHKKSLLFGIPMIQAFHSERNAAPFGIFLHESVRGFAPSGSKPLSGSWWRWHVAEKPRPSFISDFCTRLDEHFDWCRRNSFSLAYAVERIQAHQRMAHEYFEITETKLS